MRIKGNQTADKVAKEIVGMPGTTKISYYPVIRKAKMNDKKVGNQY